MADKKKTKRISWKTEYNKLHEDYEKLEVKHEALVKSYNELLSSQQKMSEKLSDAEVKIESVTRINTALRHEKEHLEHVAHLYSETKNEIRDIVYNRKYNTLFGGVHSIKADILKTL